MGWSTTRGSGSQFGGAYHASTFALEAIADVWREARARRRLGDPESRARSRLRSGKLGERVHDGTKALFSQARVAPRWRCHGFGDYRQVMALVAGAQGASLVDAHHAKESFPGVRILPLAEPGPTYEMQLVVLAHVDSPSIRAIRTVADKLAAPVRQSADRIPKRLSQPMTASTGSSRPRSLRRLPRRSEMQAHPPRHSADG